MKNSKQSFSVGVRSRWFVGLCFILLVFTNSARAAQTAQPETVPQSRRTPADLSPSELFKLVSPSVYVVEALDESGAVASLGSAVAIGPDRVVTNKHVVIEGQKLKVIQGDKTWTAHVLQLSPRADLCLLEVDGLSTTILPAIRDLSNIEIGERVYAIGAPQGLELTLSDGLLSGIREGESGPVIQTSAPISPGSSGGGLFDSTGRLIGITTFTLRDSQGLNFAIPASEISALAAQARVPRRTHGSRLAIS